MSYCEESDYGKRLYFAPKADYKLLDYADYYEMEMDLGVVANSELANAERAAALEESGEIMSFDGGMTYYWQEDVEEWLIKRAQEDLDDQEDARSELRSSYYE